MIRTVKLHGDLVEKFGMESICVDIATPCEAVLALDAHKPGFRNVIRQGSYHVILKKPKNEIDIGEDEIRLHLGDTMEVHIIPVVAGAKKMGGILKIVLGLALVAGAFFMAPAAGLGASVGGMGLTYGNIAMIGIAIAVAGVAQLLSPHKKKDDDKSDESFTIGNADNVSEQGVSVPIVFGRFLTGSVVMSMGVSTEQIGTEGNVYPGVE